MVHTDRVGDEEDPRLLYQVAYASDASGDWDIYVASTVIDQPGEDETLASLLPRDYGACRRNITGPGDALNDLWPAWLPDGSGIVYSSAGPAVPEDPDSPDPLGEGTSIHRFDADGDQVASLVRDPESADTQPSVATITNASRNDEVWLAYTTTRSSPNGSIAIRNIDGAGYGVSRDLSLPES